MKTIHILLIVICSVLFSCKPAVVEVKFSEFDLTMSAVEGRKKPEFKKLGFDKIIARYKFHMAKEELCFQEIENSIYPVSVKMLAESISSGKKFESMLTDTKYPNGILEFANGAFGVLYSKKGSSGKTVKDYVFYFKKGERYFRIYPVFNNELNDLDQQLSAIESLK